MRRGVPLPAPLLLLCCLTLAGCALGGSATGTPSEGDDAPEPVSVARWAPSGLPTAVVLTLHGFNDRKAAFDEFGAFAASRGVLVESFDQRGFGARRDRGRWAGVDALVAEIHGRTRDLRARNPGVPVYVLGESMGAALATVAFTAEDAPPVDGVVLSAPAVWGGTSFSSLYRRALTVAALVAPSVKLTGRGLKIQASDNIPALEALGRDPLYIRATRIDAVVGLVELMDLARDRALSLRVPALVLTGGRDQVVPPRSQAEFVRSLPAGGRCTVVTYLRGWHLLLRDLQRERVYADALAWMAGRRLPSGLGRPCGEAGTTAPPEA